MEMHKCDHPGCGKECKTLRGLGIHKMTHDSKSVSKEAPKKRETDRKKRVPLGVRRQKMNVEDTPLNKVRRWVNDVGGRIQNALGGSYDFVTDPNVKIGENVEDSNTDLGTRKSQIVGKEENGQPIRAFLMEIDKDTYKADQEEKQKGVDLIDNRIKSGVNHNALGKNGYIPSDGIKYEQ